MPELPSVRGVARQAEAGARQAVGRMGRAGRVGGVGRGGGTRPPRPPRVGPLARLRDRIAHREFLRLLGAHVANTGAEFAGASLAMSVFNVPQIVVVPVVAVAIWALVLFASYRSIERIFLSISLVFVTYVASAVIVHPDWSEVGRALVTPRLDLSADVLLLIVAVVGTTITPYMQFYLQSAVAEKGIDEEELRLAH